MFDTSVLERFWPKVNKDSGVFGIDGTFPTECWEWTACTRGKTGYGSFRIDRKVIDSHRVSYVIHFGSIGSGLCVLHKCDNRKCVNPQHLFQGTKADNHADMVAKGRRQKPNKGRRAPIRHGTIDEYKTFGCRCDECKAAQRDYMRQWRMPVATTNEPDVAIGTKGA